MHCDFRKRTLHFVKLALAAVLLVSAGACQGDDDESAPDTPPMATDSTPRDSLKRIIGRFSRPATTTGLIDVKGSSHLLTLNHYTTPAAFPLRFTTYLPSDLQPGAATIGATSAVTFAPHFNGMVNPDALVTVQVDTLPFHETDPAGRALRSMIDTLKVTVVDAAVDSVPWATAAKTFRLRQGGKRLAGRVITGTRGRHNYIILVQYPVDLTEEVSRRVDVMLREWRWEDDFTYLIK